jgi:ComF family protein
MSLRSMADAILSALLAPPCAVCGHILDHPLAGAVCGTCWASIAPSASSFSLRTIPLAQAIGAYDATLREVLHALKYDGRRSVAPPLSRMMAVHGRQVLQGADVVVPVPLHRRRQRQRGFNQAEDLARGLGLPVARALRRVRATQPQVDLPADERRENVKDAFTIHRPVNGAIIVLVDDVATTGATLEACARVLRDAGAKELRALTAARVACAPHRTRW